LGWHAAAVGKAAGASRLAGVRLVHGSSHSPPMLR